MKEIKRIVTSALAAAMLAASAGAAVSFADAGKLSLDPMAPVSIEGDVAKVSAGMTANELRSCFTEGGVSVTADGAALSGGDVLGTGAVASLGGDSVAVAVVGDVNGDGKISVRDVMTAMKLMLSPAEGAFKTAADVTHDGELNSRDITAMMRYLVGWDEPISSFAPQAAAKEDASLEMYFDSLLHRVGKSDTTVYGDACGVYYATKNELEDAKIVLTASEAKSGMTLEVGELKNARGDTLATVTRYGYYYEMPVFNDLDIWDVNNTTEDYWADPYPTLLGAFDIGAKESQTFMVQFEVPADAQSGWYRAKVCFKNASGEEVKCGTLYVYVWDFALEEETACDTLFSTGSFGLAGYYAGNYDLKYASSEIWDPIYVNNFYHFMLKNRISGYELPYDLLDPRVDAYLDNPRVTSFVTKGDKDFETDSAKQRLRAQYAKLETKESWRQKAYIYTVDEPSNIRSDEVINQWNSVKSVLGDTFFQTVVPYANRYISGKGVDQLEYLWDYCNAFCPQIGTFTVSATQEERKADREKYPVWGDYMDNTQFLKYGNYQPRYEKLRERGDNMWWYTCVSPEYPYANFFNVYQGAWTRVVLWEQYLVHADGLLYWMTNLWQVGEKDSRAITLKRTNIGGDGTLIYDGMLWNEGVVPVPTSRFEAVRDGIEDFQYLCQLERLTSREEALKYTTRLTTDVTHFEKDYHVMESVRRELGFALEELSAN